jgi:octanoyl-[GcvH]:protein N-octanoyltransferase
VPPDPSVPSVPPASRVPSVPAVLPDSVVVLPGGCGDDMGATRELLRLVARGEHGPALRLYQPRPTVAFGRRETHHRGYPAATAAAGLHGFEPVVRNTGGRAVAYDDGCLIVELIAPDPSPPARLTARFAAFSDALAAALRSIGVDAAVGRLDGEFCPGDFSVIGAGSIKLAGTAQRLVAGAWLCSASITVSGAAPLRNVLVDVYRELEFGWRPETLGSVTDLVPSLTMTDVENAVIPALGGTIEP